MEKQDLVQKLRKEFVSDFQDKVFSFQVDYENNLQHDSADFGNGIYNKPLDYARKKVTEDYHKFTDESREFFIEEIVSKEEMFGNLFLYNFKYGRDMLDIMNKINCAYEKTIDDYKFLKKDLKDYNQMGV